MTQDAYTSERVRLALEDLHWEIRTVHPSSARDLEEEWSRAEVLMIPLQEVSLGEHRHATLPVLAYGPAAVLDVVPTWCCDDLLVEPWTEAELRYRLLRLARRTVTYGGHTLSWHPTCLIADESRTDMSMTEYRILEMLLRARGDWVPREALAAVSGVALSGRSLDMHVSRLRRKLRDVTAGWERPPQLVAQRGFGYAMRI